MSGYYLNEEDRLALLVQLCKDELFADFRVVGGTALSFHIGHRKSEDVDLFTNKDFDSVELAKEIREKFDSKIKIVKNNSVLCYITGIKVDLIAHKYDWLKPLDLSNNLRLASLDDVAAMKIHAVTHDGSRLQDFVDIYALLEHKSLNQLTRLYTEKYKSVHEESARRAVIYHDNIQAEVFTESKKYDLSEHGMIDKHITWLHIKERLFSAALNQDKIYSSTLDKRSLNELNESLAHYEAALNPKPGDMSKGQKFGCGFSR